MSTNGIAANKLELLMIAKAVADEKSIDQSIVLEAIEEAIQKSARLRYGSELDIRATLNPQTGEQSLRRVITIVEDELLENESTEVSLSAAQMDNPEAEVGGELSTELPPLEFGRVQAQMSKQVIMGKILPRENVKGGDRIRAYIMDVREEQRGSQIFLSSFLLPVIQGHVQRSPFILQIIPSTLLGRVWVCAVRGFKPL